MPSSSPRYVISSPERAVNAARIAATLEPAAAILTADLEDSCPAKDAPVFAQAVRNEGLSFPVAIVFFFREFETLAISVAPSLTGKTLRSPAGKPICTLGSPRNIPSSPEGPRDAKGWVSMELMGGLPYKPTVHQLPLTRAMRIADLRAGGLSSFVRLERGLHFLANEVRTGGTGVYP
ncbi:hypothetical protein KIH74_12320 [Kineosporia sp. J2-2]|uniref:Uncharacterized protein n=1 Tax=Kineosporia corallincola TaxID=2835133 RepID=A0ABS5TF44_9ACTN|nr:hypothetical protein [Kineosporia corallincola]MBT0769714.1 hypothetical protein [Kineosporia corallincola]